MMILITYDVETTTAAGSKRLRRVAKECTNYGQRVQNSVFECVLSEAQFVVLKSKIESIIDEEKDSIRFYFLGKNWERHIVAIGKRTSYDINSPLII
jgi:CRISPR-associated protein Cas2